MAAITTPHIIENEAGAPIVEGADIKVVVIARERLDGPDAGEIRRRHPALTPGRAHSALAHDSDRQAAMDEEIARRDRPRISRGRRARRPRGRH